MGGRRPSQHRGRQSYGARQFVPPPPAPPRPVKQEPTVYGLPFVLLEDAQKNTFEYVGGNWQPYSRSIAECKLDSQVKQLSQKVNNMTRYEVRLPV